MEPSAAVIASSEWIKRGLPLHFFRVYDNGLGGRGNYVQWRFQTLAYCGLIDWSDVP